MWVKQWNVNVGATLKAPGEVMQSVKSKNVEKLVLILANVDGSCLHPLTLISVKLLQITSQFYRLTYIE